MRSKSLLLPQLETHIVLDLGLIEYVVGLNEEYLDSPKSYRQHEQKLALWQRRMSRRTPGGSNWKKAKQKVTRVHEHIANTRHNFFLKLTTKLIRENQRSASSICAWQI
ncbi:transposase [Paenibacillus taichungensis]|uniref:transposase n=1 Tax=Paenibacillus taichungensis TaxID=484184 RepID=UPI002872847A|nr:transposase [Paenibacillus taichungensis]MDR9748595.1 transposase [Paenibacillus taichungensis]